MAEVLQLVPPQRPYLSSRQWSGPEGGNIVILPCIRRERIVELTPAARGEERGLGRRGFAHQAEADA